MSVLLLATQANGETFCPFSGSPSARDVRFVPPSPSRTHLVVLHQSIPQANHNSEPKSPFLKLMAGIYHGERLSIFDHGLVQMRLSRPQSARLLKHEKAMVSASTPSVLSQSVHTHPWWLWPNRWAGCFFHPKEALRTYLFWSRQVHSACGKLRTFFGSIYECSMFRPLDQRTPCGPRVTCSSMFLN